MSVNSWSAILAQVSEVQNPDVVGNLPDSGSTELSIAIVGLAITGVALLFNAVMAYAAVEHRFRSRLAVSLREKTFRPETIGGKVTHYVHLRITNVRGLWTFWRPSAEDIRVYLSRIDRKMKDGWETELETGSVMLMRQFEGLDVKGSTEKYKGTMQISDLGRVVAGEGFTFKTAINVAEISRIEKLLSSGTEELRVFVHAKGSNSPPSRIAVVELSGDAKNPNKFKFFEVPLVQALKEHRNNSEPPDV